MDTNPMLLFGFSKTCTIVRKSAIAIPSFKIPSPAKMELKTGKSFSFIAVNAATVSVAQSTPTTRIKSFRGKSINPAD